MRNLVRMGQGSKAATLAFVAPTQGFKSFRGSLLWIILQTCGLDFAI